MVVVRGQDVVGGQQRSKKDRLSPETSTASDARVSAPEKAALVAEASRGICRTSRYYLWDEWGREEVRAQ